MKNYFLNLLIASVLVLNIGQEVEAKTQKAKLNVDGIKYKTVEGDVSIDTETGTIAVTMLGSNSISTATVNLSLTSPELASITKGDSFEMVTGNEEELESTIDKVIVSFDQLTNADTENEYTLETDDSSTVDSGSLRITGFNSETGILTCVFKAKILNTLATDTLGNDDESDDESFSVEELVPVSGKFFLQLQ